MCTCTNRVERLVQVIGGHRAQSRLEASSLESISSPINHTHTGRHDHHHFFDLPTIPHQKMSKKGNTLLDLKAKIHNWRAHNRVVHPQLSTITATVQTILPSRSTPLPLPPSQSTTPPAPLLMNATAPHATDQVSEMRKTLMDWTATKKMNHLAIDKKIDQASRVRQMIRTKTLQLQLETEIQLWQTKNKAMHLHPSTKATMRDIVHHQQHNMYTQKIKYQQHLMENQKQLYEMLHHQNHKDRFKLDRRTVIVATADKFVELCKWRACARVNQQTICNALLQQTTKAIQMHEHLVTHKLSTMESKVSTTESKIQAATNAFALQQIALVKNALNSRSDQQLTTLISSMESIESNSRASSGASSPAGNGGHALSISTTSLASSTSSSTSATPPSTPSTPSTPTPLTTEIEVAQTTKEISDFVVSQKDMGKVVWVNKVQCWGTIRFVGTIPNFCKKTGKTDGSMKKGLFIGVSLSLKKGLNDGTIGDGKTRMFPCKPKHGIFVRPNCVREHPAGGNPRLRKKRAMQTIDSLSKAKALKITLARLVKKHSKHDVLSV
jgi:hypothetical protein